MRPPHELHDGGSKEPDRLNTATLRAAKAATKAAMIMPATSLRCVTARTTTRPAAATMTMATRRVITRP